ncbi:Histidine kinase [Adhaeribacter pallidiroseus]|uniref:histidine kinase n=2 Tax=Adhaeribacter pallidiroseus TaxID=2072847 RepID=A0A369QJ52_9BACT|nr:Histidine kinase [Adhaeribacter pallidiroseus]
MIHDFVDNEFLESSQVVLRKKRIDIVQKLTNVLENYQQQADLLAKVFILKTSGHPIYLYLDEMKFMQAINNLISNAIKFTNDNGQITVSIEEQAGFVIIQVADNGIGIPERFQKCLFDKFTKARRRGIRGEKTTGLGMSIIKLIVELHHGTIWFESEENKGSTFFVQVPMDIY